MTNQTEINQLSGNPEIERPLNQSDLERLVGMRSTFSTVFPDKVKLDFTVAICTYNGEHRLPGVLECLKWQLNTEDIVWEVLVIDNNSTDGVAQVVKDFQQKWPQKGQLRYGFELKQGAGYARHKAVQLARSPLIGFLDDDNLPSMIWVSAAYEFAQTHPAVGVYGSRIRGDFEINPPENFERIAPLLALTERGGTAHRYPPHKKVLPPGAGMVVRRQAWLDNVPENVLLSGRTGKSMLTGEDLEAVLHIQGAGWEVWYNPGMRLYHSIPGKRLKREYLISLCRGIGLSRHRTRMLSVAAWRRPIMTPLYMLNDIRKIFKHLIRYRQCVVTDVVTACEMTLYLSSLVSPFYLWQRQIRETFHRMTSRDQVWD
ncbi:MAG: hormogonium polysaccharide biosynthesis glycosyltransferase HpsE [Leptolyngbyaceae cyanobacterium MO_188.B28]|nr:hormogonium polysaccharide biosynthesis glycosyltransferase HpsE [Leptolyngbyaceae cyanobacterium MO_188.B28]